MNNHDALIKGAITFQDQLITVVEWITLLKTANEKHDEKWFNDYLTFMFRLFDVSCTFY